MNEDSQQLNGEPTAGAQSASVLLQEVVVAFEREWEYNHSEHCRNEWPHDGDCHWPRPEVLERLRELGSAVTAKDCPQAVRSLSTSDPGE